MLSNQLSFKMAEIKFLDQALDLCASLEQDLQSSLDFLAHLRRTHSGDLDPSSSQETLDSAISSCGDLSSLNSLEDLTSLDAAVVSGDSGNGDGPHVAEFERTPAEISRRSNRLATTAMKIDRDVAHCLKRLQYKFE
ncbi:hypothetical protein pipiens_015047, partial [Culex pipiens pipiens]